MNDEIAEMTWTLDRDETSWSSWAGQMVQAKASPFMRDLITLTKLRIKIGL